MTLETRRDVHPQLQECEPVKEAQDVITVRSRGCSRERVK